MKLLPIAFLVIIRSASIAQVDSIFDQGTYRTFMVHTPLGYSEDINYPLVMNFHGLGSNAIEQRLYSQFDAVADEEGFIVVYPDAINNSWDLFGNIDVTFLSNLVDSLRLRYSLNDCIFLTGMSQGGFLSYKLACEFPKVISAISVVTGNMLEVWQTSCSIAQSMPVMHFHGTADQIVNYYGSFGVSPVEETIQWWAETNHCNSKPEITDIPDINQSDGSTVQQYHYNGCDDASQVFLFKIFEGGHTWPGAFPLPSFGNTNQDIVASEIIGNFFKNYCSASTGVTHINFLHPLLAYPNPANQIFKIDWPGHTFEITICDLNGKLVFQHKSNINSIDVDCNEYSNGIYLIELISDEDKKYMQKVLVVH